MNKLTIIGNLTRDPELRTTTTGKNVCSFTVAVNRRQKKDQQQTEADFFRVSAWDQKADVCSKFLSKGKKVCVIGAVSVRTYESNGKTNASLEVTADEIEFLSPRAEQTQIDDQSGMEVVAPDDLPY